MILVEDKPFNAQLSKNLSISKHASSTVCPKTLISVEIALGLKSFLFE